MKELLYTIMTINFALAVSMLLVGCGGGDDDRSGSGGVQVSGDNNEVFVVDGQFSECSGVVFRFVSHFREASQEQTVCADPEVDNGNCSECFDDGFLEENGYLSNEGCVEDRVLIGLCGSEQLQEQAQAAARQ